MIGHQVNIKVAGELCSGIVVAIQHGKFFRLEVPESVSGWDKAYPGWDNELVVTVQLDKPARPVSFAKFKEAIKSEIPEAELEEMYKEQFPYTRYVDGPMALLAESAKEKLIPTLILLKVCEERVYQDKKWGGKSFDAQHSEADWLGWIDEYTQGKGRAEGKSFEDRMIKGAALCIAALEAKYCKKEES